MSSHPRMSELGSKDVDTCWSLWKMACCLIWCSLTRNLCVNHQNDRVWGRNASVEGRRVSRRQNPISAMVWAAITATRKSPLIFVPSGVKLNSQRYISDILEGQLLPWVREHFEGAPWTFQQNSAPSHGSRMTQGWIQGHIPAFISKEDWPSNSPVLNPLDFSVWSILESKTSNFSWFSRESEGQIAAGMTLDPSRSSICLVQCLSRETEANF